MNLLLPQILYPPKNKNTSQSANRDYGIGSAGIKAISHLLSHNKILSSLNITRANIEEETDYDNFITSLEKKPRLAELNLSENELSPARLAKLARYTSKSKTLTFLVLIACGLTDKAASSIFNIIDTSSSLRILFLQENNFGRETALAIANALKKNTVLEILNLSNNQLTVNLGSIAESLQYNSGLCSLDIGGNHDRTFLNTLRDWHDTHARQTNAVGQNLDNDSEPQNPINESAKALLAAFSSFSDSLNTKRSNITIKYLSLTELGLQTSFGKEIARMLLHNNSITRLDLNYNYLARGSRAIAYALMHYSDNRATKQNTSLTELELRGNRLNKEDAKVFAEMLKTNTSLKKLVLGDNKLYDQGGEYLASALTLNRTLMWLSLDNTEMALHGHTALKQSLEKNPSLTCLSMSHYYYDNREDMKDCLKTVSDINALCERNKLHQANWASVGVELRFMTANHRSPFRDCILPLLPSIEELADNDETNIAKGGFSKTLYFSNEVKRLTVSKAMVTELSSSNLGSAANAATSAESTANVATDTSTVNAASSTPLKQTHSSMS